MVYFQTEFNDFYTGNLFLYFIPVSVIAFIDFLLERITLTNTKNWTVYSVLFLSSSLWVYFIVWMPLYLVDFYSFVVSSQQDEL
mmetsp:Transcript_21606/g.27867  ORF Transcript_21606/g.27867 Transcript_21606/m.27867 type:complete len:84 (+) Transcript_21606:366-617(+)